MDVKETKKDRLVAALHELNQSDDKDKSMRAQLEEIFDEVESLLSHDVRRKHVMAALEKAGLVFTLKSFETTCARIRKKRKGKNARQDNFLQCAEESALLDISTTITNKVEVAEMRRPEEPKPKSKNLTVAEMKQGLRTTSFDPNEFDN